VSVTVVGSLNEDVLVAVRRLPGRGETVIGSSATLAPGGKGANQAAAAGLLGPGVHAELRPEDADAPSVRRAAVVLLQLEIPLESVEAAARAATGTVVLTPAPPRPLPAELLERVDVLVPNEHELVQLAGAPAGERTPAELAALARGVSPGSVVVTLGARGALVVPHDGPVLLQAPPPVTPVDTTGAGDCFCGALAQALARGGDLAEAVRYAVAAAALSTTGAGARGALPGDDAVRALLPRVPAAVPVS
jgi:ribokinase